MDQDKDWEHQLPPPGTDWHKMDSSTAFQTIQELCISPIDVIRVNTCYPTAPMCAAPADAAALLHEAAALRSYAAALRRDAAALLRRAEVIEARVLALAGGPPGAASA
jgi:hypothetical protein